MGGVPCVPSIDFDHNLGHLDFEVNDQVGLGDEINCAVPTDCVLYNHWKFELFQCTMRLCFYEKPINGSYWYFYLLTKGVFPLVLLISVVCETFFYIFNFDFILNFQSKTFPYSGCDIFWNVVDIKKKLFDIVIISFFDICNVFI